jgi:hypothetical protein
LYIYDEKDRGGYFEEIKHPKQEDKKQNIKMK